jgi:hypothetical protein
MIAGFLRNELSGRGAWRSDFVAAISVWPGRPRGWAVTMIARFPQDHLIGPSPARFSLGLFWQLRD